MPSNTRGKIKEHLEGVHRNTEAIKSHLSTILALVADKNIGLTKGINALSELNEFVDYSAKKLYSVI
jgi:hypothetical protein